VTTTAEVKTKTFLAERYYVTFDLWNEPSVCRLWRCCTLGRDLKFPEIFLHRLIAREVDSLS